MTREFTIARGWKIFTLITVPALIALFGWLLLVSIRMLSEGHPGLGVFMICISGGIIMMLIYGLVQGMSDKLVITPSSISLKSTFGTKTLDYRQVKGFSLASQSIVIFPTSPELPTITVSTYYKDSHEIIAWLEENFNSIEKMNTLRESKEILSNQEFGVDKDARRHYLRSAIRACQIINGLGIALGLWAMFYPHPYEACMVASLLFPIIPYAAVFWYRGLVRFDKKNESPYPTILYGLILSGCGLMWRAITDYNILHYEITLVSLAIGVPFLSALILLSVSGEFKTDKPRSYLTVGLTTFLMAFYGLGASLMVNCLFDKSEPLRYRSKVIEKDVYKSTYTFRIDPCGENNDITKGEVTERQYTNTNIGDSITVYVRKGSLESPWYDFETDDPK